MFRKMRRFKQQLSNEECIEILKKEPRGVLALLGDNGYTYAVPLDFIYDEGKLYFHCAKVGHKIDAIKKHNKVSFCVMDEGYRNEGEWALNIKSVIIFGTISVVEDHKKAIDKVRLLGLKFNPDPQDVELDIKRNENNVRVLELTIDHMTGKLVNEA